MPNLAPPLVPPANAAEQLRVRSPDQVERQRPVLQLVDGGRHGASMVDDLEDVLESRARVVARIRVELENLAQPGSRALDS